MPKEISENKTPSGGTPKSNSKSGNSHSKKEVVYVTALVKNRLRGHKTEDDLQDMQQLQMQNWFIAPNKNLPLPQSPAMDLELSEIQHSENLGSYHRGRWMLDFSMSDGEKNLQKIWQVLEEELRMGKVDGCNAVLKENEHSIWLYCDFSQSLEVHQLLKKTISLPSQVEFFIPCHGTVLTR